MDLACVLSVMPSWLIRICGDAHCRLEQTEHTDEEWKVEHAVVDWGSLPFVVLDVVKCGLEVEQELRWSMIRTARLVNRHWARWAAESVASVWLGKHLGVQQVATKFPCVRRLDFTLCDVREVDMLTALTSLRCLESIHMGGCHVRHSTLIDLAQLKALTSLNLKGCGLTDAALKPVRHVALLKCLHLGFCDIGAGGLQHVAHLPALAELSLDRCKLIADDALASVGEMTVLTNLNLEHCHQITDNGLEHLRHLTALRNLNLSECRNVTNKGLEAVGELGCLIHLDLTGCFQITNAGLAGVAKLGALTSLSLSDLNLLTNAGLGHLGKLENLEILKLDECMHISDVQLLCESGRLTSLKYLSLARCGIRDDTLECFKCFVALKKLKLAGCPVSHPAWQRLSQHLSVF
ncbi:unnamed protein product [Ostreobium quekettii]|uniref:F-box/LRR-repeat protein 15-like leucin rich repeat domain-containing protein n=1 Tax=Ostreobium quekettii TaxID=121088 RepID=A0A8S1J029_9CHLO|nr:unnamed protein product [Ostreobium quekettii]|eukprot:evm.model.scf_1146EXC.3 EVM.evm.TU.scf_1146EXC.3   scf_1146EXC:7505-9151(+)